MEEMSDFVANLTNYTPDKEFRFCCRVFDVFRPQLGPGTWVKGPEFLKTGGEMGFHDHFRKFVNMVGALCAEGGRL